MTPDPYESYLRQAEDLYAQGHLVKAGQIWQAVLKQQPGHQVARERLLQLKQHLLAQREQEEAKAAAPAPAPAPTPETRSEPEEEAPVLPAEPPSPLPPPVPVAPPPEAVPVRAPEALHPERLLAEGCTLYDMGQLPDALLKWEQALAVDPDHALARNYANGVRRELGLAPLEAQGSPKIAVSAAFLPDDDLDKLLREAVQLYDMGLIEDAISKWERILVLDPQRQEVEGYLRDARLELTQYRQATPAPGPAAAPTPGDEALTLKLRQAEHLLTLQRHEEAAFTFQQALSLAPGNPAALAGLERCRKPASDPLATAPLRMKPTMELDSEGRIAMAIVSEGTLGEQEPRPVEPPASLRQTKATHRLGLNLPKGFDEVLEQLPWLKNGRVLAIIGGSVLTLGIILFLFRGHIRDQELERSVKAARAAALDPLKLQTQIHDLGETPEALREEAQAALDLDPLRAYLRAETLVVRAPGDAAAAQLLEKARAALPGGATGASLPEYQKHLQNGDLEAAAKVMDALLRATPTDPGLKARAARLHLLLCAAHVGQEKWDAAAEDLRRGRALFPEDKSWQARLYLLEHVKALPKPQKAHWTALLG